ncbi:hypothetical protein L3Q82_018941 [Scortum barcoo]|uniref:Uncharacterized protein n=1 Tax=Scortum barcoo TaxID=214431 RepID=A0ACB8VG36_9TELE|nr:hypothetical protein L3Q82_018941 [Scortum barcoo]
MVWMLDGTAVLTISNETGALPSVNPNVTAEKIHVSRGDSWVFVLKNTERHNQGPVTCDLQGIDRKQASLFVQEKGSLRVFGENVLAFKGKSVLFECQAVGWYPQPTLQWEVNDKKVSQSEYNISSSEESGKSLFTVTSNLSVTAEKSSHVDCLASVSALPTPLRSSVRLTVVAEVVQEGDDCTVLQVVTATLSALLLLLLCVCTVLWYRQRRQATKGYLFHWTAHLGTCRFDQSGRGRSLVAEATGGQVNLAYSSESPTDADYNGPVVETGSEMDFVSFRKVPDVVSSSSLSLPSDSQAQCPEASTYYKNGSAHSDEEERLTTKGSWPRQTTPRRDGEHLGDGQDKDQEQLLATTRHLEDKLSETPGDKTELTISFGAVRGMGLDHEPQPLPAAVNHTCHFVSLPDASKTDLPEDFDIDMGDPETEKAAVAIQSQFRKFQKKKRDEKS